MKFAFVQVTDANARVNADFIEQLQVRGDAWKGMEAKRYGPRGEWCLRRRICATVIRRVGIWST